MTSWKRCGKFIAVTVIALALGACAGPKLMVEPVAVAAHAVELTPVSWNDTAVVVGSGMIGLFVIQVLRARGCGRIIAVDRSD